MPTYPEHWTAEDCAAEAEAWAAECNQRRVQAEEECREALAAAEAEHAGHLRWDSPAKEEWKAAHRRWEAARQASLEAGNEVFRLRMAGREAETWLRPGPAVIAAADEAR